MVAVVTGYYPAAFQKPEFAMRFALTAFTTLGLASIALSACSTSEAAQELVLENQLSQQCEISR